MRYAEVAVDAPIGYGRTLSYSIPPRTLAEPGQVVWVPLGPRPVQGVVFQITDQPQVEVTRDIIAAVKPSPLVATSGLVLASWISNNYMSPLFASLALMLPPGFRSRVRSYLRIAPARDLASAKLDPEERAVLDGIEASREISEREAAGRSGKGADQAIRSLVRRGLLQRRWQMLRPKMSHKYESYIRPSGQAEDPEIDGPKIARPKQATLYRALTSSAQPIPLYLARKEYGVSAVDGLLERGLLALEWVRVDREPALLRSGQGRTEHEVVLTPEQDIALAEIVAAIDAKPGARSPFLLHGVTGSGKTEVYIRALEHCVKGGRKGMYLVPEIALTPQTIHRLNARFPGKVAVLHSRLPVGEQFDQWWRIRDGDYDVVVGARSAIYAPIPDLGLVIIDEEHEWTYKQQDTPPYYHARDVALELARLVGATVVMGSATPDVVTYHRAKRGGYRLLELPRRVAATAGDGTRDLARVEVCDMRKELREGNRSIFSRALTSALEECIKTSAQAILFLNRRGAATVVQCRDCGYTMRCRRCSVTLTHHTAEARLVCHQCNRRSPSPRGCPQCRSPRIRYLGLGTQRVVEELGGILPGVTVLRWDRDTASSPGAHDAIMERFLRREAQVLVGTQMVAKGLHVPNVSLVGVVLADVGLNLPDFRAVERTFQHLCQVAGRAGRGPLPGRVIIQTYDTTSYGVQAAARQDYSMLYDTEIEYRREHANPPFNRLVHMVYLHPNLAACQREAARFGRMLRHRADSEGLVDLEVIGPAPGFPERVRGRYRWHLILRGRDLHQFLEGMSIPQGWIVDVDPMSVL